MVSESLFKSTEAREIIARLVCSDGLLTFLFHSLLVVPNSCNFFCIPQNSYLPVYLKMQNGGRIRHASEYFA